MKKFRTTFVLLAVFLGLLAFVYFVERDREVRDEVSDETETYNVVDFDSSQVKEVVFTYDDKNTKVVKEGEDWKITEPIKYKARADKITETFNSINKLTATQELKTDDLTEYGLNEPNIKMTLTMQDESSLEILLGEKNIQETGVYVKTSASDKVFLTNTVIEAQLKLDEEILKED